MKWFARGRLWDTQELERDDFQRRKRAAARPYEPREGKPAVGDAPPRREADRRGKDWRPGGAHKDPRDRFKKKNRPTPPVWTEGGRDRKPWHDKPIAKAGGPAPSTRDGGGGDRQPWRDKPAAAVTGDRRPWNKPDRKPWPDKAGAARPFRPAGGARKPWTKPGGANRQPWRDKSGAPQVFTPAGGGKKPWNKPGGTDRQPWRDKTGGARAFKPAGGARKPWRDRPGPDSTRDGRRDAHPPSKRIDEPARPPSPEQIRTKPKPPGRG